MSDAIVQSAEGCTLEAYAAAKRLPVEFLKGLGLRIDYLGGTPAVAIPYLNCNGEPVATRFRMALGKQVGGGPRFRWKSGTKAMPYGLSGLAQARREGYVVLVEGESDTHTLLFHGIPVLGIPGAGTWQASWCDYLEGIPRIYLVVEPDAGGTNLLGRLGSSAIRDRLFLITLGEHKDPSELFIANPEGFRASWGAALEAARPWRALADQALAERARVSLSECGDLATAPDILARFERALGEAGVVGEARAAKLLFLSVVSRHFSRPISAVLKGTSSAGKSYVLKAVLAFFPATAYYELTSMSDRLLAYLEEPLQHRMLVVYEAAGMLAEFVAYLIRSLLSEGRIRYAFVEKTRDGMKPRVLEREGPTGLLVTTTRLTLDSELETRMLTIPTDDSREQTKAIMRAAADTRERPVSYEPWHALQEWLAGARHRVVVPFSSALAESIQPVAVRLRRDIGLLLGLIRAHAMLHQATRQVDDEGRVVATMTDYAAVRELVGELLAEGVQASVSPTVRETVHAVQILWARREEPVSVPELAKQLNLDKSAAHRRAQAAIREGFLHNLENRPRQPARLKPAGWVPQDEALLPTPEALASGTECTNAASQATEPGGPPSANVGSEADGDVSPVIALEVPMSASTPSSASIDPPHPPSGVGRATGPRPPRMAEECPHCRGIDFLFFEPDVVICRGCHRRLAGSLQSAIDRISQAQGSAGPQSMAEEGRFDA